MFETLVLIRKAVVVEPQAPQNGRVQIMDVDAVFGNVVTIFVGSAADGLSASCRSSPLVRFGYASANERGWITSGADV